MRTSKRINLLFVIPNLRGGGAERVIVTLLKYLDPSRFNVSIAVVDPVGNVFEAEIPTHVEVFSLNRQRVRQAIPGLMRLIWSRRPDIVFTTLGHLNMAAGLMRWTLPTTTRLVAREATILSRMVGELPLQWFWRGLYQLGYRGFDRVVCQSEAMRSDLRDHFHVPEERLTVINNPVDVGRVRALASVSIPLPRKEDGQTRFVAAGRLSAEKGFDLLIEGLAACADPKMTLDILGEGPLRGELEQLAKARGVQEQVTFLGFQGNPYPYIRAADWFVLSSRYEGFPNVVLEALACGTPVISTPIPAAREILDGIPGCQLTEAITASALERAMRAAAGHQRLEGDEVAPYEIPRILGKYESLLLEVMGVTP